jgi:hypothetical protein
MKIAFDGGFCDCVSVWSFTFRDIWRKKVFENIVQWRIFERDSSKLAVELKILCNEKLLASCFSFYAHICMVLNLES